jgi:MOSC domain-containing protein YiiM
MVLERIYVKPQSGGASQQRLRVDLVAGMGIEGDRYFGIVDEPSVNVTLIEAEALEDFLQAHRLPPDLSFSGRNLVTRGVRLNAWVGREFHVGQTRLRGVELADPCGVLGQSVVQALSAAGLAQGLTPGDVVRHFVQRGGLRAEVVFGGEIRVGDPVLEGF